MIEPSLGRQDSCGMTRGLDLKIGSVPPPAPNAGHPAGSSSANCHARHDIAVVEQIVQLELHIPGAQAEVGHGIHRGVARQGDRVAGVGEPRSHIVQAAAQAKPCPSAWSPTGSRCAGESAWAACLVQAGPHPSQARQSSRHPGRHNRPSLVHTPTLCGLRGAASAAGLVFRGAATKKG